MLPNYLTPGVEVEVEVIKQTLNSYVDGSIPAPNIFGRDHNRPPMRLNSKFVQISPEGWKTRPKKMFENRSACPKVEREINLAPQRKQNRAAS